jgi:hypothetical protein
LAYLAGVSGIQNLNFLQQGTDVTILEVEEKVQLFQREIRSLGRNI